MANFIGFNTIEQFKKFTLTDNKLIVRDFVNALNIKQGEKPGLPEYGTSVWDLVFATQTPETQDAIEKELLRVAEQDPRLLIESIEFYPFDNGLRIELLVQLVPEVGPERLAIFFDQGSNQAALTI